MTWQNRFAFVLAAAGMLNTVPWGRGAGQKEKIKVAAAENFYADIARQIGDGDVEVVSIMSDPNVDPHEYEPGPVDALAIAGADIVIENGADYDNWMARLMAASPSEQRRVLRASSFGQDAPNDNPHIWYNLADIRALAGAIAGAYEAKDPAERAGFEKNLRAFESSLEPIEAEMESIHKRFGGTPVGLTETIFLNQARSMKLDVMTPPDFLHAIADGNDPPVRSIAAANAQVTNHQIKVLIYNLQTVTPITAHLAEEARDAGIPVVGISETMPAGENYQSWMLKQIRALWSALETGTK